MRLFLKYGSTTKVISDISLRDGHQPAIGDTLPCQPQTGELIPIEPAVWYKTLLIHSILIDCDSLELKWKREKFQQLAAVPQAQAAIRDHCYDQEDGLSAHFPSLRDHEGSLFGRGVYDYEPATDTVFQEVIDLLEIQNNKKVSEEDCNLTVLRILHCYILPQIILSREDLPLLEQALKFMDRQMQLAETAIDKKSENVEIIQVTLKKMRESFIDEFQREACVRLYNTEFLRKMLYKLQNDIDELSEKFEYLQNEVNQIKRIGNNNIAVGYLLDKRKVRDLAWKRVERATIMRENIRNVVARPQKVTKIRRILGLKPTLLSSQNKYMEVHKLLEEQKAEMLDLYGRKVKVISVKEAIKSAVTDLAVETETVGVQLKVDGSERATDVMGTSGKPEEWMTLEERVGQLIIAPNTRVNSMHKQLCLAVKDQINTILDEEGIFTGDQQNNVSLEHLENSFEMALDLAGVRAQRRRARSSSSRLIQSLCLYGEETVCPLKMHCETIRNTIHVGIEKNVQCLKEEHLLDSSEGKLWMCYETHIYPQIMSHLVKLYQSAFKPLTVMLAKRLPTLTPADLNVQEDWILELTESELKSSVNLQKPPYNLCSCNTEEETCVKRPLSDCSDTELPGEGTRELSHRISYELSGKSLHELYERANTDGQKIHEELISHGIALEDISIDKVHNEIPVISEDEFHKDILVISEDEFHSQIHAISEDKDSISSDIKEVEMCNVSPEPCNMESDCHISTQTLTENNGNAEPDDLQLFDTDVRFSFKMLFQPAINYICSISDHVTVLSKLIQLTKAFRFIGHKVSELRSSHSNRAEIYRACCDDMVTVCLLILTYLQPEEIQNFYINLSLMYDLMAPCLRHGVHDCTMINFKTAFQYALDQLVEKQMNKERLSQSGDSVSEV